MLVFDLPPTSRQWHRSATRQGGKLLGFASDLKEIGVSMSSVERVINAKVNIQSLCFPVSCFSPIAFFFFLGLLIPAWRRSWVFCVVGKELLKIWEREGYTA